MKRFTLVACLMAFTATSQVSASGKQDPYAAAALSLVIPGAGQVYNGQHSKGIFQFGSVVTGFIFISLASSDNYYGYDLWRGHVEEVDPDGDDNLAVVGLGLWLGMHLWSVIDAPLSAQKINEQRTFGHLMEFDSDQSTLGIDPVVSREKLGTMLTFHF